jgi:hypothetical protein
MTLLIINESFLSFYARRGSSFWDMPVNTLWLSMVRKQLMYDRTSPSLFGVGGSKTESGNLEFFSIGHFGLKNISV